MLSVNNIALKWRLSTLTERFNMSAAMHNIQLYRVENTLIIDPQEKPDWDNFIAWGQKLLNHPTLHCTSEYDSGADKHKLNFTFVQQRYSLNYESYSDSVWIEAEEPAAVKQLEALLTIMVSG